MFINNCNAYIDRYRRGHGLGYRKYYDSEAETKAIINAEAQVEAAASREKKQESGAEAEANCRNGLEAKDENGSPKSVNRSGSRSWQSENVT